MAETGLWGMGEFTQGRRGMVDERPRERLGRFLRERFKGSGSVKRCAAALGTTPKVAENAMLAHWPGDETFAAIVRAFGKDVLDAVFAPEIEPVIAKLQAEEARLAEALEAIRSRRRQLAGDPDGGSGRVAAPSAPARPRDRRN